MSDGLPESPITIPYHAAVFGAVCVVLIARVCAVFLLGFKMWDMNGLENILGFEVTAEECAQTREEGEPRDWWATLHHGLGLCVSVLQVCGSDRWRMDAGGCTHMDAAH